MDSVIKHEQAEIEKSLFPEKKNPDVALSNALIQAREKTSLLESKIELLAIARMNDSMQTRTKTDAKGKKYSVHYVTMRTPEIKHLTNLKGGGLYQQIMSAVIEMKKKLYIYSDEATGQFMVDNLYGMCDFKAGKLTVEFNPNTEYLFLELKKNFSRIPLGIALSFKSNGGFQLYKLLKTKAYKLPDIDISLAQEELPEMALEYNLTELRMQLGYVDIDQDAIQEEAIKKSPNYDKIDEIEKKKRPKYRRWADFYKKVLAVGMDEINKMSDIYISSIDSIRGAHGKIEGVIIKMQHNHDFYERGEDKKIKTEPVVTYTDEEIDDFLDDMRSFITEPLKTRDLKAIAKESNYDMEKIRKAYDIVKDSKEPIENIVGFMRMAIREEYTPGTPADDDSVFGQYRKENKEKLLRIHREYSSAHV